MKKPIISFIVVFLVLIISYEVYEQLNKKEVPGKTTRLPCMAKVISFERAYDKKGIDDLKNSIKNGDIKIRSSIDKATFMDSTLFETVDIRLLEIKTDEIIRSYASKDLDKNSKNSLEFIIFENDKNDPKKKSDSCKLFRGYVVMKFKNQNNKVVYQNQIDFMDNDGKDIPQALQCAIKAFMSYE